MTTEHLRPGALLREPARGRHRRRVVRLLRRNAISGLFVGKAVDPVWAFEVVEGPERRPRWLRESSLLGGWQEVPAATRAQLGAFVVPLKTVSAPNVREHRMEKARRVASERERVAIEFRRFARTAGAGQLIGRLRDGGVVVLTRRGPGELDDDNLGTALKGVRDEIAAQLGVDDGDPRIRYQTRQEPGNAYSVIVRLIPTTQQEEHMEKVKAKLIMLVQPDCTHCTAAKPLFAALASKHADKFEFATIDFTRKVQPYDTEILAAPTFRLENPQGGGCAFMVNPTQMEDGLTEETLLAWATSHMGACPVKRPKKAKGSKAAGKRPKR